MSMTSASSEYFEKVAGQWDEIRSSYFTEAVREATMSKANLLPGVTVADVGAGTGFMAAGLTRYSATAQHELQPSPGISGLQR